MFKFHYYQIMPFPHKSLIHKQKSQHLQNIFLLSTFHTAIQQPNLKYKLPPRKCPTMLRSNLASMRINKLSSNPTFPTQVSAFPFLYPKSSSSPSRACQYLINFSTLTNKLIKSSPAYHSTFSNAILNLFPTNSRLDATYHPLNQVSKISFQIGRKKTDHKMFQPFQARWCDAKAYHHSSQTKIHEVVFDTRCSRRGRACSSISEMCESIVSAQSLWCRDQQCVDITTHRNEKIESYSYIPMKVALSDRGCLPLEHWLAPFLLKHARCGTSNHHSLRPRVQMGLVKL